MVSEKIVKYSIDKVVKRVKITVMKSHDNRVTRIFEFIYRRTQIRFEMICVDITVINSVPVNKYSAEKEKGCKENHEGNK